MVDVARDVRARRAVDGPARIHLEQIAIVRDLVALLVREERTNVFHDVGILLDRLAREYAKPGARASHAKRMLSLAVGFAGRTRGHAHDEMRIFTNSSLACPRDEGQPTTGRAGRPPQLHTPIVWARRCRGAAAPALKRLRQARCPELSSFARARQPGEGRASSPAPLPSYPCAAHRVQPERRGDRPS